MEMLDSIFLLLNFLAIMILMYQTIVYYKKYVIYYNNYKQVLKALGEYDPDLKAFLERTEKNNGK